MSVEFPALSVVCGTICAMTSFEGLVVRLDPNDTQASYLAGCAGAYRKAYNYAVEQLTANTDEYRFLRAAGAPNDALPRSLSARDVQDAWHRGKATHAPWHAVYPSKIYLFALQAAHRAHRNWMTGKAGYPRWQTKYGPVRFKVCESIHLQARHLSLPKMGPVRVYRPDPAQARVRRLLRRGKARIVSASVRRSPTGVWTAALTLEVEKARSRRGAADGAPIGPARVVGVDLGVKTRAVGADPSGVVAAQVTGVNALRDQAQRLRRAQRVVSRKDRAHGAAIGAGRARRSPSRRREKARLRVARLHRDVANTRATLTHQLTAQLARLDTHVVVEDLAVRGMTARGGARKKGLNRAVHDAALAEIRRQLAYKLPDGHLLVADRWYPSSKTCSRCGGKNQALTLADRSWTCDTCGTRHDRDLNAAINLAAWGKQQLGREGVVAGSQVGDRDWPGPSEDTPTRPRRGLHARGAAHHPTELAPAGLVGACVETGTQHPHTDPVATGSAGSVWDGPGHGPAATGTRRSRVNSSAAHPG